MNKIFKKTICVLLSASILVSFSACSKKYDGKADSESTAADAQNKVTAVNYNVAAQSYKKSETVYVNMNPDGEVSAKTVTDWLHTDKAQTYIDDVSDLSDIKNVKSTAEPIKKDGVYRWNMETTDLYYRGKTDKELPVNFNMTYYLDGKEIKPEKLAGKKGQVKIVITVNNESKKTVKIGGKDTSIYTPFIIAGGMILPESSFSNISVENGKTIGDGTKEIALIVGAPGLKESLNLSDELLKKLGDFNFSDTYTITMNTEKFEISNMMFAVLPLSAIESGIESSLPNTVSDVKKTLNEVQGILNKFNSMNVTELLNTLFANTDNLQELASSVSDITKLYNDNKALIETLEKYMTAENIAAIQNLIKDVDNSDLQKAAEILSDPILQKFFKQLPAISKDLNTVIPMITGLSADMQKPEVQKALNNLPQTIETLKKLKSTVDKNKEVFDALEKTLDSETLSSLKSLMNSLETIISENDFETYACLANNADELIERAKLWIDAGKKYNIFTTAGNATSSSVMFIYETSPVSAPTAETEPQTEPAEENAVAAWFKKLFKKDK